MKFLKTRASPNIASCAEWSEWTSVIVLCVTSYEYVYKQKITGIAYKGTDTRFGYRQFVTHNDVSIYYNSYHPYDAEKKVICVVCTRLQNTHREESTNRNIHNERCTYIYIYIIIHTCKNTLHFVCVLRYIHNNTYR